MMWRSCASLRCRILFVLSLRTSSLFELGLQWIAPNAGVGHPTRTFGETLRASYLRHITRTLRQEYISYAIMVHMSAKMEARSMECKTRIVRKSGAGSLVARDAHRRLTVQRIWPSTGDRPLLELTMEPYLRTVIVDLYRRMGLCPQDKR